MSIITFLLRAIHFNDANFSDILIEIDENRYLSSINFYLNYYKCVKKVLDSLSISMKYNQVL